MKLNIKDRLVLLNTLPPEGSFATVKIVHELKMTLAPSEEEAAAIGLVQEAGQVRWDPTKDVEKDIPMGKVAKGIIESALKKLDAEQKLTPDHLGLYEKFVVGEEEEKSDGQGS
jgi:hypothetical protein